MKILNLITFILIIVTIPLSSGTDYRAINYINSSSYFSNYYPLYAFDNSNPVNDNIGWLTLKPTVSIPQWIQYNYTYPQRIISYTITSRNSGISLPRSPKSWTLQGSNDNISFIILDTKTNIVSWATTDNYSISTNITYPNNYMVYRISVTDSNDVNYMGIGELYFYTDDLYTFGGNTMNLTNTLLLIITFSTLFILVYVLWKEVHK